MKVNLQAVLLIERKHIFLTSKSYSFKIVWHFKTADICHHSNQTIQFNGILFFFNQVQSSQGGSPVKLNPFR